ncbi:hypothetical protein [Actinacidiphila glaucinigra]|uniref:hypothetical protein n=1 Tax=Actinacidiphila glaucinigra TaxID=235986 RepID=UPI002E2F29B0|nr:hypothetical protein [Actinacidiphila glaucinigra]
MSAAQAGSKVGLISESASLLEVILGEASVSRGSALNHKPGLVDLSIESTATFSRHSEVPDVSGVIICKDDYVAELTNQDGESIAEIKASFVAAFSADLEVDPGEEALNDFANSTGRLVLRPYAREFMQQMTIRMGLPALTLEVLRFRGSVIEDGATDESSGLADDFST